MASDETCSECQESSDNSIGEVNSVSGSEVNAVGVAHTVFHVSAESDAIDTSQCGVSETDVCLYYNDADDYDYAYDDYSYASLSDSHARSQEGSTGAIEPPP